MFQCDLVVKFTDKDVHYTDENSLINSFGNFAIDETENIKSKINEITFKDDEEIVVINEYYKIIEISSFDNEQYLKICNCFGSYIITQVVFDKLNVDLRQISGKEVFLIGYKRVEKNLWHLFINLPDWL